MNGDGKRESSLPPLEAAQVKSQLGCGADAPSVTRKPHIGGCLRVGIGAHVDQCSLATLDGAFDRRTDLIWALHEFSIAAERFDHLVIALEAEIAAHVAASLARGEPAVVRDHYHDGQAMPNSGVHFHPVPAKCPVAAQHHYGKVRAGGLRTDSEGNSDPHASMGTGIETAARLVDGNRLTSEI